MMRSLKGKKPKGLPPSAKKYSFADFAKPIASRNTSGRITEDDPRWDWRTMGNNMRGPTLGQRRNG